MLALLLSSGMTTADAAEPGKPGLASAIPNPISWLKKRSARKKWEEQKSMELLRQAERAQAREPVPQLQISGVDENSIDGNGPGTLTFSGDLPAKFVSEEGPGSLPDAPGVPAFAPFTPDEFASDDQVPEADFIEAGYQNTASDPQQLRSIKEILPYADYRPEMKVETGLDPTLKAPQEVELSAGLPGPRQMDPILYQWHASNLYHYPLYFEDPALERYGHTHDEVIQPFVSIGKFGLQLAGLPYQMTIDPVCKKRYTLGWYRPGECAPKQVKQIPWNTQAAINQAAFTTGAWFALP